MHALTLTSSSPLSRASKKEPASFAFGSSSTRSSRLPLRLRSDLTFGGVREAEALEYTFVVEAVNEKANADTA